MHHIPNALTISRYAIAAAMLLLLLPEWKFVIAVLGTIGALTDLDGYIARRFNWQSQFGAEHDPIADKFFCWSFTAVLWGLFGAHWYVVTITILQATYDAISIYLKWSRIVGPVSKAAKWKTLFLMTSLMTVMWSAVVPDTLTEPVFNAGLMLFVPAVVLGIIAGRGYVYTWLTPRTVLP